MEDLAYQPRQDYGGFLDQPTGDSSEISLCRYELIGASTVVPYLIS